MPLKLKFNVKDKKINQEKKHSQTKWGLGTSLFLKGELTGEDDFVIEGEFQGKIDLKNNNLTVERGGKVKADIQIKNITVSGEVKGNIHASEKVFIAKEGYVKGDITAPRISIADGAQFKGTVKMESDVEEEPLFPAESVSLPEQKVEQSEQKDEKEEKPPPPPDEPLK